MNVVTRCNMVELFGFALQQILSTKALGILVDLLHILLESEVTFRRLGKKPVCAWTCLDVFKMCCSLLSALDGQQAGKHFMSPLSFLMKPIGIFPRSLTITHPVWFILYIYISTRYIIYHISYVYSVSTYNSRIVAANAPFFFLWWHPITKLLANIPTCYCWTCCVHWYSQLYNIYPNCSWFFLIPVKDGQVL